MNPVDPPGPAVGVDLLRIGELDRLLTRPWFRQLTYSKEELTHSRTLGPSRRREFLAGRFAAKEAVAKLLGTGLLGEVRPAEIAVTRTAAGAPQVRLSGGAAAAAARLGLGRIAVSISHKDDLVTAVSYACPHGPAVTPPPERPRPSQERSTDVPAPILASLRVRIGQEEAHYGSDVVDGARILRLFGDLVTEITIRTDGDEGLLSGYSDIKFLAPVHPGDYIEATATLVRTTRLRRVVEFEARKVIAARYDRGATTAEVLAEPVRVCTATGISVVPYGKAARNPRTDRTAS